MPCLMCAACQLSSCLRGMPTPPALAYRNGPDLQVAATPKDPQAKLQPRSDASDARWFSVDALPTLESERLLQSLLHARAGECVQELR